MSGTTGSTEATYRCTICGAPADREPGMCSPHCRVEADLELRRNRARMHELRRGLHVSPDDGRELRGIYDRNAELVHALINSVPPRPC